MPAHAVRRRPALPALLLTVAAAALGGLALLPAHAVPAPAVLASSPAAVVLLGETERAAVLGRPPVLRTVAAPVVTTKRAVRAVPLRAARKRAEPVLAGYVCPVRGPHSFTDTWGDPRPGGRRHQGNDVMAPYGTPVVAVTSGVIKTNYSRNGGISLYLEGTDGDEYFYAHNSRNVAVTGQHVATGELIGYVGNTGDARGGPTHVHFERHPGGGRPVDPYSFLIRACGA
ncbi:MAG: family metallopeptidase [Frankiales bacterium]|nr:family metallopeptidase [Frankiales bacterium]